MSTFGAFLQNEKISIPADSIAIWNLPFKPILIASANLKRDFLGILTGGH